MSSRYYIYGDKVYYRYNRKGSNGRALRNEDIAEAFQRRKAFRSIATLCVSIAVVICINFVCSRKVLNIQNELTIPEVNNISPVVENISASIYEQYKENTSVEVAYAENENNFPKMQEPQYDTIENDEQYVDDLVYRHPTEDNNEPEIVRSGDTVMVGDHKLVEMPLPSAYYEGLDFSSFQPYECVSTITNTSTPAYNMCYSDNVYTDGDGLLRHPVSDDMFSIDGIDDYVVAMGTFYKDKGTVGQRFLIQTTTGEFTVITGDEKSDAHTDKMNMFTTHNGKAGIIEWIVDTKFLDRDIRSAGTVTAGNITETHGTIIHIYEICS